MDVPMPVPVDDQVLVKVYYCGVCGTDIDLFSGNSSFIHSGQATYPIRLGHEWSGVVAAVGPQVTSLKVGDVLTPGANGILEIGEGAMKWQVVKVYTMPDHQRGVKIMRIA